MSTKIIPFGKYKGQPVEVLKEDDQYREWLMQQDWLRSRFPELRTIIVNNFGQPNDTPEHNAMVAKFIDDDYCMKFIRHMQSIGAWVSEERINQEIDRNNEQRKARLFGEKAAEIIKERDLPGIIDTDKLKITHYHRFGYSEEENTLIQHQIKKAERDAIAAAKEAYTPISEQEFKSIHRSFELQKGSDIGIAYPATGMVYTEVSIECKPVLSDDFPSVLRQCRDQGSNVLVVEKYTGKGATIDQVRAIYQGNPIVVMTSDYE